jgi:ankyrin repeat protein
MNNWTLVLKRLLERGLDANTVVNRERERFRDSLLRIAERGLDAESEGIRGSLLYIAVAYERKPAVELLLEFGADIEAVDMVEVEGMSPLEHACYWESVEMVRLLLETGACVNGGFKYPGLETPLHAAVGFGKDLITVQTQQIVKVLLEFGADINALDVNETTPLMHACTRWPYHKEIMEILLENGADVEVGDWEQVMFSWDHEGIRRMLKDAEEEDIHPRWKVLSEGIRRTLMP